MKKLPPEILDVLDRVDWSEMQVSKYGCLIRGGNRCPLEAAFNLRAGNWSQAPIDTATRSVIVCAGDGFESEVRSEMLRRIEAKTPRVIK